MATTLPNDRLLTRVTCAHCWETFSPEQVLWVSEHADLLGDPLLGPEQQQRFLPSRFTLEGDALDAMGMVCRSLACPKCHLSAPRCALEMETLFLSILGAPASGKSYFLSALIHELRRVLPMQFGVSIGDVDPASNRLLNECEDSLFFNMQPDQLVPLGALIRKTELEGELYETISLGNQTITYSRPFLFDLRVRPGHPKYTDDNPMSRVLCLYDNAGEHFLPGKDTTATPVTRHLAQSRALLFVLDPTQDPRFSAAIRAMRGASVAAGPARMNRQEMILHEAAARVRRYTGLSHAERHPRPLIIVLTKLDQWSALLRDTDPGEPWRVMSRLNQAALDIDRIEEQSGRLRQLLMQFTPEIVNTAEAFAQDVFYIATSALGEDTEVDPESGFLAIRPQNIKPRWATAPLLYALSRTVPGLIPRFRRKPPNAV